MTGPQATAAASDATDTILVAKSTSAQKPSDVKPAAAQALADVFGFELETLEPGSLVNQVHAVA